MKFEIEAEARQGSGRSDSRKLRRTGRVPAIVYGGGKDPSAVTLDGNTLYHQMEHESFYTSILTLTVDKNAQPVVVKEVQRHPAKSSIMHLDFQRVVEDEELTLTVPIHFIGEAVAPGAKIQGGVVEHILTDVEITCLPANLPEFLELDVSNMELNDILHLSDIKFPEGVTSTQLEHGQDSAVVAINPPRREEEDEEPIGDEAEGAEVEAAAADDEAKDDEESSDD
ncbi:MAG: 50S ribosomal protein L25/general stress protein Ctc [Gammaproteobacteria bacterium]|nr:50S ribosomal protein L25/general stress protein Ctc [Gammaproteobacteria bacterium]